MKIPGLFFTLLLTSCFQSQSKIDQLNREQHRQDVIDDVKKIVGEYKLYATTDSRKALISIQPYSDSQIIFKLTAWEDSIRTTPIIGQGIATFIIDHGIRSFNLKDSTNNKTIVDLNIQAGYLLMAGLRPSIKYNIPPDFSGAYKRVSK